MVTHSYSPYEGHRPVRAGSYPPADRRQTGYPIYPDPRGYPYFTAEDDAPTQRKRIAVACGRCRKRKIRCSGDNSAGLPCTNCRNAGYEPCLFLRVASQEAQMKQESFNYNMEASRQYHSRGSTSSAPAQGSFNEEVQEAMSYRSGQPPFSFDGRVFEPVPSWPTSLTIDQYPGYAGAYPIEQDLAMAYRGNNTAVASSSREGGGQSDHSSYLYGNAHATTSLVHRPAPLHPTTPAAAPTITSEPTDDSYQTQQTVATPIAAPSIAATPIAAPSIAAPSIATPSIATPSIAALTEVTTDTVATPVVPTITSIERTIPTLAERHLSVNTSVSNYRPEAHSPTYTRSTGAQSPESSTSSSGGPLTPASDTSSPCYASYEPPVLPSSALPYPAMTLPSQVTRSHDIFAPSTGSESSLYSPSTSTASSLRAQHVTDMTYRYTDTTVSDTGEPTVGMIPTLMERRSPPTTDASLVLTHHHQHHGNASVGRSRQHHYTPYAVNDGGVALAEPGPTDEDRKPGVVRP